MPRTPPAGPVDLDALLRPVLKRTKGSPEAKLKATIRLALETEGVDLMDARNCLRPAAKGVVIGGRAVSSRSQHGSDAAVQYLDDGATVIEVRPTVWSLVNEDRNWNKLVRQVQQRIERSPSPEEARAAMVRQLVARALLPWPESAAPLLAKNVNGRAAFAVIAQMLIADAESQIALNSLQAAKARAAVFSARTDSEREAAKLVVATIKPGRSMDTAIVTANSLATKLGWYPATATNNLNLLVDLRYILKTNETGPGRFRLTALTDREVTAVNEAYGSSIESYLAGRQSGLMNLLKSVLHPAFTYGADLDHKHWLYLVAGFAGAPLSRFRMNRRIELEVRRELDAHDLSSGLASFRSFGEALDQVASQRATEGDGFTSWDRQQAGIAAGAERAAASIQRITANRDGKKRAYASIDALLKELPIPDRPNEGRRSAKAMKLKQFQKWRGQMRLEFEKRVFSPKFLAIAESSLRARLGQRGYDDIAHALVREIIYGESPKAAESVSAR